MVDEGDDERGFFAEQPLVRPRKPDQAKEKPHYLGHRDRLRERFTHSASDDNLADYELLELILFRLIPRSDTKPVAKALLARFGSLPQVLGAPPTLLQEVKGVGSSVALDLKIIAAAARRMARGEIKGREILSSWNQVLDYCRAAMAFEEREQFRILFLDKKNALIADEVQQTGTVDHTPVYPARGDQTRTRTVLDRRHTRPQPPVGRSGALARRHRDDEDDHRDRQAARHFRARPHHHRQEGLCQHEGAAADLMRAQRKRPLGRRPFLIF